MKEKPTTCHHPEVIAIRKMDPLRLGWVHRCTSCHQLVTIEAVAA